MQRCILFLLLFLNTGVFMTPKELYDCLAECPIIAAVHDDLFERALHSPASVLFLLGGNLLTVEAQIKAAQQNGKRIFIHIDLADGIGKDRVGIEFLARCGADGIISTRANMIRTAKDLGLMTVQRFFALDSQGVNSITEMLESTRPHLIEIMPGIAGKIIKRFTGGGIPVIAGGLIETKAEVTEALGNGAEAVSTGKEELWAL